MSAEAPIYISESEEWTDAYYARAAESQLGMWVKLSDDLSEFWRGTLAEFFVSNDLCDADRAEVLRGLAVNGCVHVGGGASPVFVLEVLP